MALAVILPLGILGTAGADGPTLNRESRRIVGAPDTTAALTASQMGGSLNSQYRPLGDVLRSLKQPIAGPVWTTPSRRADC
jgi:hypothetical protein